MRFWKLGLLLVAVVIALSVGALITAPKMAVAIIDRGGGDNVAVAFNTRDDSSSFVSRFKITRTRNETVDQQNAAIAYASCDSCQTVANATQVVLVMRDDVNNVSPTNVAVAVNENCTDCDTLASAYQKVLNTGGPVHFTAEGNRRIAELRQRYQELRNSGYSIEEIQTQFDEIWAELNDILATELVPSGNSGNAPGNDEPQATSSTPEDTAPAPTEPAPAVTQPEDTQSPTEPTSPTTSGGTSQRPVNTPERSKSVADPATSSTVPDSTTPSDVTTGDSAPTESVPAEPKPASEEAPKETTSP